MILAALPYPPLPIVLSRQEDSREQVLQTSHDLISMLLRESCAKRTVEENRQRQHQQQAVLADFMREVTQDRAGAPEALYALYCTGTMRHVACYLPPGAPTPDIRFLPLAHPCKGDVVHAAMCDYMAAQARILELPDGICADNWRRYEYADMLLHARSRLVSEAEGGEDGEE